MASILSITGIWSRLKIIIKRIIFQSPIIIRKADNYPNINSKKHKPSDEVSEHISKNIQSITEQLEKVSAGAYSCSLKQISQDIISNNTFKTWCQDKPLIIQLINLFNNQLDQFFERTNKYKGKTSSFGTNDISEIYYETTAIIIIYRSAVSEFIQLLNNWEKEGAPQVWDSEPLSGKIYRELRDNYDELMQRVKTLKTYADEHKLALPSDDQLTKFDRIPGIMGP